MRADTVYSKHLLEALKRLERGYDLFQVHTQIRVASAFHQPLLFHEPLLGDHLPRPGMHRRPQALRDAGTGIRKQAKHARAALGHQARSPLAETLDGPDRALPAGAPDRLHDQVAQAVGEAPGECLSGDDGAALGVGDGIVTADICAKCLGTDPMPSVMARGISTSIPDTTYHCMLSYDAQTPFRCLSY